MLVTFNSSAKAQPSFGMAKLTRRGETVAKRTIGELTEFCKQDAYKRKNLLKTMLKSKKELSVEDIDTFFRQGATCFSDKNAQFIKKQLMPMGARSSIKRFLEASHSEAIKILERESQKPAATSLTQTGDALVQNIMHTFDSNINNPQVSSKSGKKMLDLIKSYLCSEEHITRMGIVTDKIYSK